MRIERRVIAGMLVSVLAFAVAFAGDSGAGKDPGIVKGEVVQVRQSTSSNGDYTEIKVRNRQQQETWLRLGPADMGGNGARIGDLVRARVLPGDGSGVAPVRSLQNWRTGQATAFRSADGTLLQSRDRSRLRDGTGDGVPDRDRIRQRDQDPLADATAGTGDQDRVRQRDRDRQHDPARSGTRDRDRVRDRDRTRPRDRQNH